MRRLAWLFSFGTVLTGVAHAQTSPSPPAVPTAGYVEVFAQSAFGSVTSQAFGGEAGFTVRKNLLVFVEIGEIRDVAPTELGTAAQLIAGALSQTQSNVSVTAKEPATFGTAGVKYLIPVPGFRIEPYVLAGFGVAKVTKDVVFTVGGSDVTSQLLSLGVQLGSDLSGDFTKPAFTIGGGVDWPFWRQMVVDLQFRFTRIGAEDDAASATSVGRAGVGVGVRF